MYMTNVQYVTLTGNSIGNVTTGETEISNAGELPCPHNDHLTFRGNVWHDFLNPGGAADHMECLQFDALTSGTSNDNIVLKGNRFENCGQYGVFVSGPMNGWRIENNYFDEPCSKQKGTGCVVAGGALSLSQDYSDVIGQFNLFAPGTYPQFSILPGNQSGGVWRYNINGSFPDTIHCGSQNNWTLIDNHDAAPAVCGKDVRDTGQTRLLFLSSSLKGRAVNATYGLISPKRLRIQFTVFGGGRKLTIRTSAGMGIHNSPGVFTWRSPAGKPPTRLCARAYDGDRSVSVSCTSLKG
jgi:hypothetical protein